MKNRQRPPSALFALVVGVVLAALSSPVYGQGDSWQPREPLPRPRRLLAAVAEGGRVYTFGGCGSPCFDPVLHPSTLEETLVEVYDPQTNRWTTSPRPMPAILFGGSAVAPGNGRIYTFGGYASGNVVQEYDPQADAWHLQAPMPTPRFGLAAVALDGKVYALGGSGPTGALEIYDPAANAWSSGAPMPTPRVFLAAAAMDGKIYAMGGSPDCCGGSQTHVVEVYDPASDSWTSAAPLPVAQQLSGAVAVNGKIYALGGFVPGVGAQGTTYEYDPQANRWVERAAMPVARDQAGVALAGGSAYVLGGSTDCHCRALDPNDRYDPTPPEPVEADLAISMEGDPGPLCPGEQVHYRITARNNGPAAVDSALVRDIFPTEVLEVEWTCSPSPGATCHGGGGNLHDRVRLPVGGRVVYTVVGTVNEDLPWPAAGRRLRNSAEIVPPAEVPDQDLSNNNADARTLVIAIADLVITKSDGVSQVTSGGLTTYVITVSNIGPCPVTGASVRDPFGPGLAEIAWTCVPSPGAACQASGSGRIHDLVNLPFPGEVVYTAQARVTAGVDCPLSPCTPLSNTARVLAPGGVCGPLPVVGACDPEPVNNRASDVDAVIAPPDVEADLAITKTIPGEGVEVLAGEEVAFEITVRNAGPEAVTGALVRDELPAGLEDASWTCSSAGGSCSPAGDGGIAETVSLPAGAAVLFSLRARTRADFCGSLLNTASVVPLAGVRDPDFDNNSASAEVTVFRPGPGFFACKRVEAFSPAEGTVTFEIELLNAGPFDQLDNQGSEFVDALPAGLELVSASASSGTLLVEGHTVVWNGSIPAGGRVTITLSCRLTGQVPASVICNRGKLFVDTDGDGFNDDVRATDDPALPELFDATCLPMDEALPIPTLSPFAALLLGLALLAVGLARLRRPG